MLTALFGITNDGLNLVASLLLLFLVVLWLALVAWTYFDARRRLDDGFLVGCAAACSLLFPFLGTIVYSILRPPEFLSDRRERELEIRASELRVRQLEEQSCPNCEHPVERTFLRCPNCRARIKDPCESCGKPIDPRWAICPYCEMPRRSAVPERRPEKRRRAKPAASSEGPPEKPVEAAEAAAAKPARGASREPSAAPSADAEQPARKPTVTPSADAEQPARKPSASRKARSSRSSTRRKTSARQPEQGE
jgi:hypothetical protein